jgi:hypothetical protein
MSSKAERIFSDAKLFVPAHRGRLRRDVIEALECLRKWDRVENEAFEDEEDQAFYLKAGSSEVSA